MPTSPDPSSETPPSPGGPSARPGRAADRTLRGPLTLVLAGVCLAFLATWIPEYLTWPLFLDDDEFATPARAWALGKLPYRDTRVVNFPGQIYLFWGLGKLFGWGRTVPYYAADAAFVVALGAALVAWSRRRFRRVLPGVVGYLAFLSYYLDLNYCFTAQRDWHAAFFAVLGLLAAEAWPGRGGRLAAALAAALALGFRPQTVLLWPAMALAVGDGARRPGEPLGKASRAVLEWGLALAAGLALVFLPLVAAGVWGDFVRSIRSLSYGAAYNRVTMSSFAGEMLKQLTTAKTLVVPLAIAILAAHSGTAMRRQAATWIVALACVLFYKPLSPHSLKYLEQPLVLVWSVNLALLAQLVLESGALAPAGRLVAILLVLALGVPNRPQFCSPRRSLKAVALLMRGQEPDQAPTGYQPYSSMAKFYDWRDYRDVVDYLREKTSPETPVANALMGYPAITGPSARPSAFPTSHLLLVRILPDSEKEYIAALEQASDSVVVWAPGERHDAYESGFRMERMAAVIERLYEPEERFGEIEVWRRKPRPAAG
jgi:hypothetical protein